MANTPTTVTVTVDPKLSLEVLQVRSHAQSLAAGFWDDEPDAEQTPTWYLLNKLTLTIGELIEAHEEIRKGRGFTERYYSDHDGHEYAEVDALALQNETGVLLKPEGFPAELADAFIRILDLAGRFGIDLGEVAIEKLDYNATRPFKHGKSF